jgi:LysR family transcriptional regulator, transcriptional activator of the cysJI operon
LDLYHLRTFLVLARVGHFSRAAEELFLTQPAVSNHIKALEEYYQAALFQKVDQKYVLTDPGKILLGYAEKAFNVLNEAKRTLDGFNQLDSGSLIIAASSNIGVYVLPKLLGEFKSRYPNIEIKVSIGPTYAIESRMLANEVDIGIVEADTRSSEIVDAFHWEEGLSVIVSPRHPWAKRNEIEPAKLADEFFIVGERGSGTKKVMEDALGDVVDRIKVLLELGSTEAVKKAVEENLGISIVMDSSVSRELKQGTLKIVELSGVKLQKTINVVHLKGKYWTPAFSRFVEFLRKSFE